MIRIEHVAGRACPMIRCADCGGLVTEAAMAGVAWADEGAGPVFLCKTNDCLTRWLDRHDCPWQELSAWLVFLVGNVGLADPALWASAQEDAAFMGGR